VGGAERGARKRRQQQAAQRAVAAARKSKSDRNKIMITVLVVLVIAGAVLAGVLITKSNKNTTEGAQIPAKAPASAELTAKRDGATVVVGKDTAKVSLDVYEDFLCPACGKFEAKNAEQIEQKVKDGTVQVRYHMLDMLNKLSDPPGYSQDSANAALCAADAGRFPAFHASLFGSQPKEGARGYDKNQLIKLGQDVGITSPDFAACVTGNTNDKAVDDEFQKAKSTDYLKRDGGFGTPTVAVGEKVVDTSDPNWLNNLVTAG
jgi:protein-disulfide isomerase